ncbi:MULTISPECIES: hypothetical protein [unclassified Fusibacter]|uniref:hypothetical protein n=1 Tax=unclassified Fusibacter TaxID=2624464 RepID=UPI0010109863|nr:MULTISPECIES: hypothetical protein [unclassified Fusibacter]MCK8061601.1 hypothetical protein [Fusibacter sp. A2]NPE23784.1 hypothetical protein [Fusibacter sp. A1]RXV58689.1 hypothetical protein DWB64_18525 [Fusibacter sp. A1]
MKKKFKGFGALFIVLCLIVSGAVFAMNNQDETDPIVVEQDCDCICHELEWDESDFEDYTFSDELDYLSEFGVELTDDQIVQLTVLFDSAYAEDTDEAWEAYDTALESLLDETQLEEYYEESNFEESIDLTAVYKVNNGKLVLSVDPEDYPEGQSPKELSQEMRALHQKLWLRVNKLIPSEYLTYFKKLEIGTDGKENIMASVVEMNDLSQWTLFLDTEDSIGDNGSFTSDFDYTVIHEFGHILTLNQTQIDQEGGAENTYQTDEGISKPASYLNSFYQKFWVGQHAYEELDDEAYDKMYEEHASDFVSDYAASNVMEDMAESFAEFVVGEKRTGDTLADEKVNFFYGYEELVKLRNEIRANMNTN